VTQTGTEDIDRLQLLTQMLGGAKSSRLDRRLLHVDKLVDQISAHAGRRSWAPASASSPR
jgi:zinc protease